MRKKIIQSLKWVFWNFSGLRLIWEKISPPEIEESKKPSTFLFWAIGIYISLFGLTSSLYETRYKMVDDKINFIYSMKKTDSWKSAIEQLPIIQKTLLPVKPEFSNPLTVIGYFFVPEKQNSSILKKTKEVLWANKTQLFDINLRGIDISGVNLMHAKFNGSNLENANLNNSLLISASFKDCFLANSKFDKAKLCSANFENAFLYQSSFKDSVFIIPEGKEIRAVKKVKKGIISEDRIFSMDYLGGGLIKNANLINDMFMIAIWKNESVNSESEDQFKTMPNFKRAILGEAIWIDGNKCRINSVGKCNIVTEKKKR